MEDNSQGLAQANDIKASSSELSNPLREPDHNDQQNRALNKKSGPEVFVDLPSYCFGSKACLIGTNDEGGTLEYT